jgi:acyl-CoA thioesterase I
MLGRGLAQRASAFYVMWLGSSGSGFGNDWQPDIMQNHLGHMVRILAIVNVLLMSVFWASTAGAASSPARIVVLGDSLAAGYMLSEKDAFPTQLERKPKAAGVAVEITNAGVSGDTTAAGLARLDWAVPDGTDAVILELGANDALRGLDPDKARRNLASIISRLKSRKIDVLLAGMIAPGNLGEGYATAFNAIFPELAKEHDLLLYPFFLQGVAMRHNLNLGDGIHPNAKGVAAIVDGIMPSVEELIARVETRRKQGQRG